MRELLSAVFKTGSGSFSILILGVLTTKIFAVLLGPSGVGVLSLLRQTRDTLLTLTTFQGNTALVQGLASKSREEQEQYRLVVLLILAISTLLTIIALWFLSPNIANLTFSQSDPETIFMVRLLALPIIFGTGIMYFGAVLNGYRAIGRLAVVQVSVALVTFLLAYPTAYLVGGRSPVYFLLMMTLSSATGLIIAFIFVRRAGWLPDTKLIQRGRTREIFVPHVSYFLSFGIVTLITGVSTTWTILLIRSLIVSQQGLEAAGIFDVAWTLSMIYITMVLTSFGTYYLPTLSQAKETKERTTLIRRVLRLTIIFIIPILTAMIVLKPLVIRLLYSAEFLPALALLRWMLIGNFLRASSWVFGVTIRASADKQALILSELASNLLFLSLCAVSG